MRYYLIAGEASGDLHGANLMKEIKERDPAALFRFWGGDRMASIGGSLVKHYRDLAFMGFFEVLLNLRTIFRNIKFCKKDIIKFNPDVIIFIDYPGFNLRIARFAKSLSYKTFYYISPQIWAWKQSRLKHIKANIDRMFVILPFEKAFYKEHGIDVDFPGHPLLDEIRIYDEEMPKKDYGDRTKEIIAILPGSRKQEIQKMLPLMLKVKKIFPGYHYIVAGVKSLKPDFYHPFLPEDVDLVYGETYSLLRASKAAIVTSGTATLEAALLGTPEIICYKGNFISYYIAKNLVKVDYIGLPNLIMNRHIVKELIQNDFTLVNLKNELKKILEDTHYRANIQNDYSVLVEKLGGYGASAKTAELMLKYLKE